ncbi:hypothetical protein BHM03_00060601, partial [Ensete ventricosum]
LVRTESQLEVVRIERPLELVMTESRLGVALQVAAPVGGLGHGQLPLWAVALWAATPAGH